jgi:DNA-binding NarL/FixJ family response regulator
MAVNTINKALRMEKIMDEYNNGVSVYDISLTHRITEKFTQHLIDIHLGKKKRRVRIPASYRNSRNSEIISLFKSGIFPRDIAQKFQITLSRTRQILTPHIKSKKSERDRKILALFVGGESSKKIAIDLGITDATVNSLVKEMRTVRNQERRNKILSLYSEGNSLSFIARNFGLTPARVNQMIKDWVRT